MGPSVAGGPVVVHDVGHGAGVRHAGVARNRAPGHGRGRQESRPAGERAAVGPGGRTVPRRRRRRRKAATATATTAAANCVSASE